MPLTLDTCTHLNDKYSQCRLRNFLCCVFDINRLISRGRLKKKKITGPVAIEQANMVSLKQIKHVCHLPETNKQKPHLGCKRPTLN